MTPFAFPETFDTHEIESVEVKHPYDDEPPLELVEQPIG